MKYMICSGYFNNASNRLDWFFPIWWRNTVQGNVANGKILIIAAGGHAIPNAPGEWVNLDGDVGHITQLLDGRKPYWFASNPVLVCAAALLAYLNECDLIYKEQDLLAFGPWVEALYSECGDLGLIMGRKGLDAPWTANSLILVKHWFIPEFVRRYLSTERENIPDALAEFKFYRMHLETPDRIGFYSFGYNAVRPYNTEDAVWYAQKFTPSEMIDLKSKRLVEFEEIPNIPGNFSNW